MADQVDYAFLQQVDPGPVRDSLRRAFEQIADVRGRVGLVLQGLLSAKPALKPFDAGAQYFATNYNRVYVWSGSSWQDAPGSDARGLVAYFAGTPTPSAGWTPATGATVSRSNPDGSESSYQTPLVPNSNGLPAWVRV